MAEAREVCRGFRNNSGRCRFGEDCKFEHSEGDLIPPPARVKSRGECFTFRDSGACEHGDRCKFAHGEDDKRFDSDGMRDVSSEICKNFQRGKCAFGDECHRMHVEREAGDAPRERKPRKENANKEGGEGEGKTRRRRERKPQEKIDEQCNNYLSGRCRLGDSCRRQHVGEVKVEKIDEQCNNYLVGRCRAGDLCRRQHTGTPNVKKLDEPCNNFAEGKCRRGDSCRRQHVAAAE